VGPAELVVWAARFRPGSKQVGELVRLHGSAAYTAARPDGRTSGGRRAYIPVMKPNRVHALLALTVAASVGAAACQSAGPSPAAPTSTAPAPTHSAGAPSPTEFVIPSIGPDRTPPPASPAPRLNEIAVTLEPFAQVPGGPLAITAPDDGSGRLFVATQDGKIWVAHANGTVLPEPMLDISGLISAGFERGLLGLATHPTFPTDPRVFINYTNPDGDSIVASVALDPGDPNRLDPATSETLLFVDQPYANHNGGSVEFGPDGMLYLSFGDGGSGGDPLGNGQDLERLLGKILRIDVDGESADAPYAVPPDNPYAGGGGLPEIWHWGLRNPWRVSFDRQNGDLWIADVGQGAYEEVDVARQGQSNLNFGWNLMEGAHCFNKRSCATEGLTFPVSEYGRDLGCTIIGGYVYRGAAYPFLAGTYLSADWCSGNVFGLDAASDALSAPVILGAGPQNVISAFGEDVAGELYVTSLDGTVFRVVAAER
jgi:glucose/arabinose dehydrogenase